MTARGVDFLLLCRAGTRLCGLPSQHVLETLRPLPVQPLAGAPEHVLGLVLIRGIAQPVVDLARLLGEEQAQITRYVTIALNGRRVALAVGQVLGIRALARDALQALPPLLRQAGQETIAALGSLDAELLLVLDGARLVPPDTLQAQAAEPVA